MKYTYILKNGKEIKLRLTSGECIEIETASKKSILDYVQEESMTMMCTLRLKNSKKLLKCLMYIY